MATPTPTPASSATTVSDPSQTEKSENAMIDELLANSDLSREEVMEVFKLQKIFDQE